MESSRVKLFGYDAPSKSSHVEILALAGRSSLDHEGSDFTSESIDEFRMLGC